MRDLNIALLQAELHWGNPQANRQTLAGMIAQEVSSADLVVLPEMFTTGFTMDVQSNGESLDGQTANWLQSLAVEHDMAICGSVIIHDGDYFYNRLLWAGSDGSMQFYDKRHLFRMAQEHHHFRAGRSRLVVELQGWRICPLICYDLRFPVWSRGANEFDLLIYVANWPAARESAWTTLLPARAVENQCYVAGVNCVGKDDNNATYSGASLIADYFGNALATGSDEKETISATLSLEKLNRYREKFPAWKDADSFTVDPEPGRS
jgi:omega-amidase